MATRDNYMTVVRQIVDYMNAFKLAFKTYAIADLDNMMKTSAGEGGRVSTQSNSEIFESCLSERGFVIFPSISNNQDGYIRIYRASSLIGNLLTAFRYPGQNGDNELARLLTTLQRKHRIDDIDDSQEI